MQKKIRRKCKCGCGDITNYGNKYINHHNPSWNTGLSKRKIRRRCKCGCGKITNYGKRYIYMHHLFGNIHTLGYKHSKEIINKMSLTRLKYNPNYEYCDIWKDKEYKKDIRKDYCENAGCKKKNSFLCNHHIYLNKKRCAPKDIITFCNSCHTTLHNKLSYRKNKLAPTASPKDYIIINRLDHISYIHKKYREVIRIIKKGEGE